MSNNEINEFRYWTFEIHHSILPPIRKALQYWKANHTQTLNYILFKNAVNVGYFPAVAGIG